MIIKKGDENMKYDLFTRISLIIIMVLLALNLILPLSLLSPVPSYAARSIQYKVAFCEYPKHDRVDDRDIYERNVLLEKLLNEYGKEGWELIGEKVWGPFGSTVIFKR